MSFRLSSASQNSAHRHSASRHRKGENRPFGGSRNPAIIGSALDASRRAPSPSPVGRGDGRSGHPDHGQQLPVAERLLTQMELILEINSLQEGTNAVVDAARESLIIRQA